MAAYVRCLLRFPGRSLAPVIGIVVLAVLVASLVSDGGDAASASSRAAALDSSAQTSQLVYYGTNDSYGCYVLNEPGASCQCLCRGYCEIVREGQSAPHAFVPAEY